ncbi:hypothetical protein ACFQ3N_07980 [Virgibacillus byunsanensis]|uniref:Uncharacterized protein n=1 Tax=Virgibacillus byunsanensis TaxID=570945 RepID=A0ABW3LL09_9BACI
MRSVFPERVKAPTIISSYVAFYINYEDEKATMRAKTPLKK